ncbi:NAD(+) synthase, partial [Candidatus Pacearchaeota archaeon]|nr:NAD(+) synthase [Candidatus Pacearchaeota archaeon]
MKPIILPTINPEQIEHETGDFILQKVAGHGYSGGVVGLSGGVDSTVTAALTKRTFDFYNSQRSDKLKLIGYILPSNTNNPKDEHDASIVAQRLQIQHPVINIEPIVQAYKKTNPEAVIDDFHKGNLTSRIRANLLSTKAATGHKIVIGTGNKDEDFGIGYYTLFGDGAVHISPLG